MSGGDGKDHNSGAHDSGGSINGTSGKGGPDSGGGYWDNHPHITITGGQEVGQGGAGINWGGGSGHGNGGAQLPSQNITRVNILTREDSHLLEMLAGS
ncbi:Uncharacterised protein [Hafnia alvei]|uniref:Uncharacterized protein n=1 Tax=Hafnia alvei TaxID=569 RepID=A0A377TFH7_HAFAL|nr:Uncharacterised protein [Hafnia alvei]